MNQGLDAGLDRLLAAYRDSFPEIEASPGFLSSVWQKIEERRSSSFLSQLERWAPRLAAFSATAALLLAALLPWTAASSPDDLLESSYLDVLTVDSLEEQDQTFWALAGKGR